MVTYLGFEQPWIIVATFFPLVYCDGFAAVFGPIAKEGKFLGVGGEKTLLGTASMSFMTWLSVLLGIVVMGYDLPFAVVIAATASVAVVFVELLSPRGIDNLLIPLVLYPLFWWIEPYSVAIAERLELGTLILGLGLGTIFAIGGYTTRSLTKDGAITGFLITVFMLAMGSYSIGIQLLLFFVLGSLATKFVKRIAGKTQEEFEKGGEQRDSVQALAKAGLPSFLVLPYLATLDQFWLFVITGLMASAIIDTLATEIGIALDGTPRSVFRFWRRAKKGDTGVISVHGTLGGLFFGLILTSSVYLVTLVDTLVSEISPLIIVLPLIGGFFGMLADSIFGATLQRQNHCRVCQEIVEANYHHDEPTEHALGISWFNNDVTNLLGTASGGIITGMLTLWFVVN